MIPIFPIYSNILKRYYKRITIIILSFSNLIIADDRLYLKQANILESKVIDNKSINFISGNVIFTKGELTLKCENGQNFKNDELAILHDNVSAKQDEKTITCDTIKFFSREDKLFSIGNSHAWDNNYDLKADSIIIFTKIDSGVAVGNVVLVQKGQIINANRIEYKEDQEKGGISYTAIGEVVIKDSSRVATCGRAEYKRDVEKTILNINPQLLDEHRILTGDKIILDYFEETLDRLHIPRNAYAKTPIGGYRKSSDDSTKFGEVLLYDDEMKGSSLSCYFIDGKLDSIILSGMAQTLYHVFEDSVFKGKNNVSGDTINFSFLNEELYKIYVNGGSEGKYHPDPTSTKLDNPLFYSSDKIHYDLMNDRSSFIGNVNIIHHKTNLNAGYVDVNWETNLLGALPRSNNDTLTDPIFPVIKEDGRDPMQGIEMTYNLSTRKGKIKKGKTRADDGYYTGQKIKNESQEVYFIESSTYTTCDHDTAHYHFESNKMKIIQNKMVVARPIVLHIGQIPIFGFPLGIFPHKGGQRHSGWIMPSYGDNKSRGQFIEGLGYYWAPNDYWDSKFILGFGDRQGTTFRINTTYRLRYKFSGSIHYFNNQFLSDTNDIMDIADNRSTSTTIRWNHRHELRRHQSFNSNITYSTSGDYNKKYGLSVSDRMNQKAISNISYSKNWPKSKNSFSTSFYSNLDLLVKEKVNTNSKYYIQPNIEGTQINVSTRTFPKFSFRHGQSHIFPSTASNKRWYNTITWSYNMNFSNIDRDYYESVNSDSNTYSWARDDAQSIIKYNDRKSGLTHTTNINAPQKLFKYISINPSINIKSSWVNQTQRGYWNGSFFDQSPEDGFAAMTTGSFSLSSNTQVYGIIPIPIGSLKAIRHVLSPSIGYSWSPDFSKPFFGKNLGYVTTRQDSSGKYFYHDRFAGTMAGSTPRFERKSMTFSLNNIFQGKIDSKDIEKKVDLMSWRINTSYNFAADSMKLSNLKSSIRSKIAGKLNLDLSLTHDFYKFDQGINRRVSELNKSKSGMISPRLTNARLSTGFRIKGKPFKDLESELDIKDSLNIDSDLDEPRLSNPLGNMSNTVNSGQSWNSSISLSYSFSAINPLIIRKTFWANTSSSIRLTQKWRISYRARFDIIEKGLVNHSFTINRDLHCWELSFNWTPNGLGQGIYLKLNVKSPILQDLKFEKRGGVYSGAGL